MAGYDMIITGGRVLDYESGLDAVRDIGVRGGRIEEVSEDRLSGEGAGHVVDAEGKWVMPGVVDAHVHVAGAFFGASDMDYSVGLGQLAVAGVTTALDLGGTPEGVMDSLKRGGSGINIGGLMVMAPGVTISRDDPPRGETRGIVSEALRRGALGIKMLGGYHPFTEEVTAWIIEECNEQRAYVAFHVGTKSTGSRLDGLRLVPDLMGSRGRLHIAHVNAYCRGSVLPAPEETQEALEIISGLRGRAVSEVHMAVPNFTRGACDASGNVKADVAQNCLRLRGYPATADGVRAALRDGYASTVVQEGGRMAYVSGEQGIAIFDERETDARLSFPVNRMDTAFQLTAARLPDGARDPQGDFVIDAVASDGGAIPRNVNIEKTMAMVRFGALTPLEMVQKLSYNPARMIGLPRKGRIAPGADADITVVDPLADSACMTIVGGEIVAEEGRVTGRGGTMLVTEAGQGVPHAEGLPYETVDLPGDSLLYRGYRG